MIDATKVRMMTKLAIYESGEGKKDLKAHRKNRQTYLGFKQLESFFSMTVAYALGAFLYSTRYYTEIMTKGLAFDYRQLFLHIVIGYAILVVVNFVVTDRIFRRRYDQMLKRIKEYDKNLFALKTYLEKEELQK